MNEVIENYIKTEKDLARYNLSILERGEQTPARKRLIDIEKEFIHIPFEKLNFSTIDEASEAINLYRQSRKSFYLKYDIENSEKITKSIAKKISFLDKISSQLKYQKIQEINVVQDDFFFQELSKAYSSKKQITIDQSISILKNKKLKELQDLEPILITKKRARLQAALYSLGMGIQNFLDRELNFEEEINSDFNLINSKMDNFISSLEEFAFEFYNDSLDLIDNSISKTMGENSYSNRIYSLDNVFSLYHNLDPSIKIQTIGSKQEINLSQPSLGNLYLKYKDPIITSYQKDNDKKTKNKVYGIIFPLERISREKMTCLYKKIFHCGIDITELFSNQISNIRVLNESGELVYYKGIFMKPLWELLNYAGESLQYHYVISKLLDENLSDISKFNNKEFISYINNKETPLLKIDMESRILIPKTRSEEQYIEDIIPQLKIRIDDIKNDYRNIK